MTGKELRNLIEDANENYPDAIELARAIVDALGITREMVADFHHASCGMLCPEQDGYECPVCQAADALTTLLDAAEDK